MVDTNQCKLLYDDNEDEYADYYDWEEEDENEGDEEMAQGETGTRGG
jgi:hypothetical protein